MQRDSRQSRNPFLEFPFPFPPFSFLLFFSLFFRTWRKEAYEQAPTKVAPPVIKPAGGTFANSVTVEITCVTPGVNIFYTTSGSFPNKLSPQYDPKVPLVLTADTNLRVIAIYKNSLLESRLTIAHFVVQQPPSTTPPS